MNFVETCVCGQIQKLSWQPEHPCMQAAYLFLLFIARLSLELPPEHQQPAPKPIVLVELVIPSFGVPTFVPIVGGFKAGFMVGQAKSPEAKAFTKAAGDLSQRCWNGGLRNLLDDRGVDITNATWAHGGLYLGALCGLWTFDVDTTDYQECPDGLAAFAGLAPGLKEVNFYPIVLWLYLSNSVLVSDTTLTIRRLLV
jgi:hypothetical protein